jgi:hypothetical protein
MTPWEMALQVLKFFSLGVSTASGWYATLNDTREKESGKLTRAGRVVLYRLVISSVIAVLSQSLETKSTIDKLRQDRRDKEEADLKETLTRQDQLNRLDRIIGTAEKASASSQTSAEQSGVAVSRLAKVIDDEDTIRENAWRQARPFGTWETSFGISNISITDFEREGIARLIKVLEEKQHLSPQPDQTRVIETDYQNTPDEWDSGKVSDNVFVQAVAVWFYRTLPDFRNEEHEYVITFYPQHAKTTPHFDQSLHVKSVDIDVSYKGVPTKLSGEITNWMDLYGSRMQLWIYGPASRGEIPRYENVFFYYQDTIAPRELTFYCDRRCNNELSAPQSGAASRTMTHVLDEDELGDVPADYEALFPKRAAAIRAAERTQSKVISH